MSDQTERAAKDLGVWAFGEVRLDDCPKETIFRALVRVYEARDKWQAAWQVASTERNKARRELAELKRGPFHPGDDPMNDPPGLR